MNVIAERRFLGTRDCDSDTCEVVRLYPAERSWISYRIRQGPAPMQRAVVANNFPYCVSFHDAQASSPGVICVPRLTGPALSDVAIP